MDANHKNFPILSYVMARLPSAKRDVSYSATDFDIENPPAPQPEPEPEGPFFEITERMPHLKSPKLIAEMRRAVSDVAEARSAFEALGTRPDHETVDAARMRLAEIRAHLPKEMEETNQDCKMYKAVITLDEMHGAYEKMLDEAEKRLERIYEAAVAGKESVVEEGTSQGSNLGEDDEMDEEVVRILKEAASGNQIDKVDLSGRKLRIFPEVFGQLKSLVALNLSNNHLETIPDSIAGLESLEELNLSENLLETLPDSIGFLFKLKKLNVSGNKLNALPDSISQCRLLVELDASFNKLAYLPTNMGFELVNLKKLDVHLNKIRSLPSSIGGMKSLCLLDVHFNQLCGIPNSIGRLTNLEILNLSSNFSDLTELPDTLTDLVGLRELDLSNNQISALPDTFARLISLTKFNVDQNPLVIPPKEVVANGLEAIKTYMAKRWDEILLEIERRRTIETEGQMQAGLLYRSTSWLGGIFSNVSGTVSGYRGGKDNANDDSFLNQQL